MSLLLPPLSLYVHIPWCVKKCPYCDFNSHKQHGELPEEAYIDALLADLNQSQSLSQGRKIHSIFIGGGTPSLFTPKAFDKLLKQLEKNLGFDGDIEITMEANPGTAEQSKFKGFRAAGINRLSIGVQSFNDLQLQALGRIHSSEQAALAMNMARKAGFDNVNLDLMHGLPGQSQTDAMADLDQALNLGSEHLSWYQLTVEPNTEFYNRPPVLPEDEALAEIQDLGLAKLAEHDMLQYEVSAYARNGLQSQHNLNYWRFGDYLGIGAGAHGKASQAIPGKIERQWKTRQPNHYLSVDRDFVAGGRELKQDELPLEFMMNALRLSNGVGAELFQQRTGLPLSEISATLNDLRDRNLLELDPNRLQATPLGQRFLNNILACF